MMLKLSLDLPEDRANVALVRHLSRSALEHLRVEERDIDDIEHIMGELATNVVQHAGDVAYHVDVELHGDRAIITVIDHGKGISPSGAPLPPPGTPRTDAQGRERIGGWGLPMVRALSDRLQFRPTDPH